MKELTAIETFQEKVKDKIKENIMDSLPDEVIQSLFDNCLREQFFKKKTVKEAYGRLREYPSWFEGEVIKLSKPILEAQVSLWVSDKKEVFDKKIEEVLDDKMILALTMKAFNDRSNYVIESRLSNIESALNIVNSETTYL